MKLSVLIVDDCDHFHKLMKAYMADDPVCVYSARNGDDAVALAEQLNPRLILLDVEMPGVDGFEVCRRLKSSPLTGSIPIVFLTAEVSPIAQMRGVQLGADDYLTKRLRPQEMCQRIRAALQIKTPLEDSPMVDGLTQLWNRTYLNVQLPRHLSWARRLNKPLACIMAEIDHLAEICWNCGERIANEVLRATGHILAGQGREHDLVSYLQDGRFALLMPDTDETGAFRFADRARSQIVRKLKSVGGVTVNVGCSFGVADTRTGMESTLLHRSEMALNIARRLGNICVCAAPESAAA